MVDSAPEVDSALLGLTVGTFCQSTKAWVLFPFTAQCLVLCGTCYASITWRSWSDSAENCGYSAVAVHRRSSISCRSAEADSHGLAFGRPYKLRSCSVCLVFDVPVVQVVFHARCCRQVPTVQILQKFVEVPQSQFLRLWTSLYHAATSCLATVKVPLIQFIA